MFKDFKDKIWMIQWVIKVMEVKVIEACQDHHLNLINKTIWCFKNNKDSLHLKMIRDLSINNFSFDNLNIYFL